MDANDRMRRESRESGANISGVVSVPSLPGGWFSTEGLVPS